MARDEEGNFIGDTACSNWQCFVRIVAKECCGGRKLKSAIIKCGLQGEVEAETKCNASCPYSSKESR